jgi:hypothetical protein
MFLRRLACAAALLSATALATDPSRLPLEERAARAQRIVLVDVVSARVEVPDGNYRRMITVTTVAVREHLKGQGPRRVQVLQAGGKSGPWESRVPNDATLVPGETAILFLNCRDAARPELCNLSGLAAGKLAVASGPRGLEVTVDGRPEALEAVMDRIRAAVAGAAAPAGRPGG